MVLTALKLIPRLVMEEISEVAEVNKPMIPTPVISNNTATTFDRTILSKTLNTWTPPKIPVALAIRL
jgi:hypothetical protein